jgi:hypothetical protein
MVDWDVSRARREGQLWRAERFAQGAWPTTRMVRREFGTFSQALAAAGFPRRRRAARKPRLTGPDEVLRAIRAWTRRYGDLPVQADWDPARARALNQAWRIERYRSGDWPSVATVRYHFGSLSAAIRRAGLVPREAADDAESQSGRRSANRLALAQQLHPSSTMGLNEALADGLRGIQAARAGHDDAALREALIVLAGTALAWAAHGTSDAL